MQKNFIHEPDTGTAKFCQCITPGQGRQRPGHGQHPAKADCIENGIKARRHRARGQTLEPSFAKPAVIAAAADSASVFRTAGSMAGFFSTALRTTSAMARAPISCRSSFINALRNGLVVLLQIISNTPIRYNVRSSLRLWFLSLGRVVGGQLGPDMLPAVGAHLLASDFAFGKGFDGGHMCNGYRFVTRRHL